jgi:hypothetical protein
MIGIVQAQRMDVKGLAQFVPSRFSRIPAVLAEVHIGGVGSSADAGVAEARASPQ